MKVEKLDFEKCLRILKKKRLGRLACSLENQPYIVPLNFVFDGKEYIYAFSTVGKKIDWMRENPLVCLEIDEIKNQSEWTTIIINGKFEELPDEPEFVNLRIHAHELLSKYPMWWQPAFDAEKQRERSTEKPVYFRIHIEKITGQRTVSEEPEVYFEAAKPANVQKSRLWGIW